MTSPAEHHVLVMGSVRPETYSTCSLVIDGDHVIVIDPGLAASQESRADPGNRRGHRTRPRTAVQTGRDHTALTQTSLRD